MADRVETADAVVVGARCAGSAAAIALARAGRRAICLDRARFPSDTLSTHLLFLGGVVELERLGALERVLATGAPRLPEATMGWAGIEVRARYTPVEGLDYALCVRRPGLDGALVETARAAGAEVRERCRVVRVLIDGGGVGGVAYRDPDGEERELRAPIVIGADGRRSLVARAVGAERPQLASANGRGCYFAYWRDAAAEGSAQRATAAQWRHGRELATAFPCDGGLLLVLLMPPVERKADFARDLEGEYLRTADSVPGLRERLHGAALDSKIRHTLDTGSYFRRSHGPGWALAGDAGHFKDPVTAQGIRDALRFGRKLGERAAPALDTPAGLDRALGEWEAERDAECIEMYQWTNRLGRAAEMSPIEGELYRRGAGDPELAREFLDVMARTRSPREVFTPARLTSLALGAVRRRARRRETLRQGAEEARLAIAERRERTRLVGGRPLAAR